MAKSKHFYQPCSTAAPSATKTGFYLPPISPPGEMSSMGNTALAKNLEATITEFGFTDSLSWSTQSSNPPDTNVAHYPRLMYYYHPDYLGHVEYITDLDGLPYQHFYYTAWGETLLDQKANRPGMNFDSPYRFNGKELDEETGLYYYGARYYNPVVSVWLGVDSLAHRSPNQTPYHFVSNNPIMRIDPDGRDDGEFEWNKTEKEWQKTSPLGDEMGVDFYHWNGEGGSQTTYVTDREGNWNQINNGRYALQGESRSDNVDYKQIYDEWKTGTGPERSVFEGEHSANSAIKSNYIYQNAVKEFEQSGLSKVGDVADFGLIDIVLTGNNMQVQMMGSYNYSFYKLGDKTLSLIQDSKSRTSFYYNANIPNYSRQSGWPSSTGRGRRETTTYQTYLFFK